MISVLPLEQTGSAHLRTFTLKILSSPAHSGLVFGVLRNRVLFPVLLSTAQMTITRRHQQTVSAADDDLDVITTKKWESVKLHSPRAMCLIWTQWREICKYSQPPDRTMLSTLPRRVKRDSARPAEDPHLKHHQESKGIRHPVGHSPDLGCWHVHSPH